MIFTLPLCIMAYFIVVFYLSKRYKEEEKNRMLIFLPKRKRNIVLLLVYVTTAIIGGIVFKTYGYTYIDIVRNLFIIFVLWMLAYIDRRERIIPNKCILMILLAGAFFLIIHIFQDFSLAFGYVAASLSGMIFGGGIFLISRIFSKKGIGMGDVKLLGALGFYLGLYTTIGLLMISLFAASGMGLYLMLVKKHGLKEELPFAPYVALGLTVGILLGF